MEGNFEAFVLLGILMFIFSGFAYCNWQANKYLKGKQQEYKQYQSGVVGFIPPDCSELISKPHNEVVETNSNRFPNGPIRKVQKSRRRVLYNRTQNKGGKQLLHKGEYLSIKK